MGPPPESPVPALIDTLCQFGPPRDFADVCRTHDEHCSVLCELYQLSCGWLFCVFFWFVYCVLNGWDSDYQPGVFVPHGVLLLPEGTWRDFNGRSANMKKICSKK